MKTKATSTQAALKRRIREFYALLNRHDFERCYARIDPRIRHRPSSITLDQYARSLRDFVDHVGWVRIVALQLDLHLGEPSALYEGRDFALGKATCENADGQQNVFIERWVREGKSWYTRSTGFIVPNSAQSPRRKRA